MKTKSINFTSDLIGGYCEESNTDRVLMNSMYEFYSVKISKRVSKESEAIEVPIKNLGIFYMPLHGAAIITTNKRKGSIETFCKNRKQAILNRIDKCRDCGVKHIKFLHTIFSRNYIKND